MPSIKNLTCLIESSRVINSSLSLSKILNTITTISKDILSAEAGSLMLLDEKTKELVFTVALGTKGCTLKRNLRIKLGKGIAGEVAKTGKPIIVKDVRKDHRFFCLADKLSGFHTRSLMCVPLKVKGKVIGVLEAINSTRREGFSQNDLDLFQAFACQVAVAIDNARMHKEALDRQRLDQELGIAREIQQSLLPQSTTISNIQILAANTPAKQIGGDLYDFFDLGSGNIGVMISDVSGKGIPAALYMVRVMSEFRLAAKAGEDPSTALNRVNNVLIDKSILGMFATMFYLVIDKPNMKIRYTSAGHLPALYYSKDKLEHLDKAQNPPLGIKSNIRYKSSETNFYKGDAILLYTDGVIEARTEKGLEEILRKDLFKEISSEVKPLDDYTLVEIKL